MSSELNLINVYSFLTPIAVILILMETFYCYFAKKDYMSFSESITNLGTAIGNQCVNLGVAFLVVLTFSWIYQYRFFTIPTTLTNFIILLIAFDFLFYWFHRHGHSVNILWAAHMPHHSSEEFNLFVGVRASITQRLFSFSYMWPLALLGFRPEAIYAASAVQLIIAFWHHTRVIGRMKGFETIFNSPSHHRVHHAINEKYLDKNFGEILIIWDKLFGTFKREEEEPVYGCLTPVQSCNPNKIYIQYWNILFQDMIRTKSYWNKIRLWFMPLGWRPEDVRHIPRFRVNEHTIQKYVVKVSTLNKIYLSLQVILGLALMAITINLNLDFSWTERFSLMLVLWTMITSWGVIIEENEGLMMKEVIRLSFSILVLTYLYSNGQTHHQLLLAVFIPMVLSGISYLAMKFKLAL